MHTYFDRKNCFIPHCMGIGRAGPPRVHCSQCMISGSGQQARSGEWSSLGGFNCSFWPGVTIFTDWNASYLWSRWRLCILDLWQSSNKVCGLTMSSGLPWNQHWSDIFLLIFFNDLPSIIKETFDCYADDSTLRATAEDVGEISPLLTRDLGQLCDWMLANKWTALRGQYTVWTD